MNKHLQYFVLPVIFFAFSIAQVNAQTIAWNFTTGTASPSTTSADVTASDLVQGNNNGTTPFITTTSASSGYSGFSGTFNAGLAARTGALNIAASGSPYVEFTLTPVAGKVVTLTAISFGTRSTSTGPQAYTLRSSADNYTTDKVSPTTVLANSAWTFQSKTGITISSLAGTPITIRLYGYNGAGTASANTANWRLDDITLSISVAGASNNANLSNLILSAGTLDPAFASTTTSYTASVPNSVSSITLTPTASDAGASIRVNTTPVVSGSQSSAISLNVGDNIITATVTAADGTTVKNYTITVNRASAGTPTLVASTLANFGNVCINTIAGPNTFTLSGSDLDGSTISLSAVAGFQYAETAAGPYSNSINFDAGSSFSNKSIYVKFSPSLVQSYNGNISINGGGVADYTVAAAGAGVNTAPSVTTGSAVVSSVSASLSGTIDLLIGCSPLSAYGFEYSSVNGFANGTGTPKTSTNINTSGGFSFPLTGLNANTTYYYRAFATNNGGTVYGAQMIFLTGAVPVPMASQEDLIYRETFSAIATWANGFTSGNGATHFSPIAVGGSTSIPSATRVTTQTATFVSGSTGGVQKGIENIVLLSTGGTDNTSSTAIDLSLDFSGVEAGEISFDWAEINNGTGDRNGSLRVYTSANGISYTELPGASILNVSNNVPATGSILNVALPASFSNNPNARLRFYYHNGSGGTTGSRPKISIDNLVITAISTTPCITPSAQPTALTFNPVTETTVQGNFIAANPSANKYLVVMSQNTNLTSNPVDGQVYAVGDNVGDGDVIAYRNLTSFSATGLTGATTYNFFVFSVNNACIGGPKYLTVSPLSGSVTTVAGLPTCAAPLDQPTALTLTASINSIQGSFTQGTASEYLVLRSTESILTNQPQNGQNYTTGNSLGNAFVVQRGNATTFVAAGLNPETNYYFFVYSLQSQNCLGGPIYNVTGPLTGSLQTLPLPVCSTPLTQPTNLSFNAGNTSLSGTFNASASADNYLVIRSSNSTLTAQPVDNTDYNVGDGFGGGTVVTTTTSSSFSIANLSPATTYYFFVFAANKNCTGGTKYLTSGSLTGSVTTTALPAYNVYFGNLHAHSDYSDGNQDRPGYTPALDYEYAKTAECMDFMGISEHNHFSSLNNPGNLITNYHKGSMQADSFTNAHPNFLAMYGMEWGVISGGGHVVVYGDKMDDLFGWESNVGGLTGPNYDKFVAKSDYTGPNGLFKTVNDYIAKNAFVTLAHPNNSDYNNLSNSAYNLIADNAIVGTAVANGPSSSTNTTYSNPGASMSYLWYYQKLLSLGYHLGPNIDHDNHNTTFGKTTRARTAVLAPSLSKTEIVKAMRDMRFYATEDCDTKIDFTVNSRVMGSIFTDRNAPSISVRLSDLTTPVSSAKIRLMFGVPGSGIVAVPLDSTIGSTFDYVHNGLQVNTTGYYYTEVTNGTARMVTSPIWYTRICSLATDTVAVACNTFTWHGTTYTSSIKTSRQFTTTGGCDSTVTLNLTINYPVSGDTTAVACESFTWYGNTYTTSGNYTHLLVSSGGCDSTLTMHLTINPKPDVSIIASGPTSFCPGGSVTLTANSANAYVWSTGESTQAITVNNSGNYTVTITDSESCTSTSDAVIVSADDLTNPTVITQSITVQLSASGTATISSADVNNGSTDNCLINAEGYSLDKSVFDCTNIGLNTVILTVTDASGNSATGMATVTVVDAIAPTFTAPAAQNVILGTSCDVVIPDLVNGLIGADNCGPVSFTQQPLAGSSLASSHNQIHTVSITANDGHGNTTTHTLNLTSKDVTSPTINAPSAIAVDADNGSCNATNVALGMATSNDNCATVVVTNDAPNVYPKGVTTVTWIATDAAGNITTATQTVTVTDKETPIITCPVVSVLCYVSSGSYTIPVLTATDNCGYTSISYAISGSTIRNGSGNNASGIFNEGTSIITWTVTDGSNNVSKCTTSITINQRLSVSVPDVYAVNPGGAANTIYKGYGPASLTLNANVSGGTSPYSYKWTIGSSAGQGISTASSFTVSPSSTTTYFLNVKDRYGCSADLLTRTINVVDVRCGPKRDKVTVCTIEKGVPTTTCLSTNMVASKLSSGGYLGNCIVYTTSARTQQIMEKPELVANTLSVAVLPNPSTLDFQLRISGKPLTSVVINIRNELGQLLETRKGNGGASTVKVGGNYRPGIYYAEVIQDGQRVTKKLIKISN